jgi:hypothetical protein
VFFRPQVNVVNLFDRTGIIPVLATGGATPPADLVTPREFRVTTT